MLGCYLKHNKSVYKKFKSSLGGDSKKRARSNSNVSNSSAASKKKTDKKRNKKLSSKKGGDNDTDGMRTRRKSSVEWQPKSEAEILAEAGEAKEFKFQRIDESKFTEDALRDRSSYQAKAEFGQTGDTYGDWSNSKLHDKVGKNFTKEKNKMKNRNFHASGGRFNMGAVNSIPMTM